MLNMCKEEEAYIKNSAVASAEDNDQELVNPLNASLKDSEDH